MKTEREISDGCGCIIAGAVVVFLLVTLAMMPTMLDSFEQKYIY